MPVAASEPAEPPWGVLFGGLFTVAFATLLTELALMRILSYTIWHHFGYVVISVALLGFGAAGTFLALRPAVGTSNLRGTLAALGGLSALTVAGAVGFIAAVPLDPMAIFDEPAQLGVLVAYLVVVAIPFFLSGLIVSLAIRAGSRRIDRLYFWDLIGAGIGCVGAVQLMNWITPPGAAVAGAAAFAAAAAVFSVAPARRRGLALVAVAILAASPRLASIPFTPAKSKAALIRLFHVDPEQMEPYFSSWTALFRTDVLEDVTGNAVGHKRFGASKRAPGDIEKPRFLLSHDATATTGIYDLSTDAYLDSLEYNVIRFPYLVSNPEPSVLVIGAGGGQDLVAAMQYGASRVTGVELDPEAVALLRDGMDDVTGGFFRQEGVELVASEGRHHVLSSTEHYDVIKLTAVDTLSAAVGGAYVLAENYLYTVEGIHDYLDHLEPGGILSFTMGDLDPTAPQAAGRIVSIAHTALIERGIERPAEHIVAVDSGNLFVEVMIRNEPWEARQLDALEENAGELGFVPLLLADREGVPTYVQLASWTGPRREALFRTQRFELDPVRDDRPFFMNFVRWREALGSELSDAAAPASSAISKQVLLTLLVVLSALGAVFILLPLGALQRRQGTATARDRVGVLLYFLAVGLGFMLFEISLIQRFVLFLGHPTYSISVTLASLLIFLGLGSYLSRTWMGRERLALVGGVAALGVLAFCYSTALPLLQASLLGAPLAVRIAITAVTLAPLGLILGLFFPLGIGIAAGIHEDLVPWAWGINGCASVTAGILAVILAMSIGFTGVWILSVLIYALGVGALLATGRARGSLHDGAR